MDETGWYTGTADAVWQNADIISAYAPRFIVLLAGDHVYKMDYEPMLQQHVEQGADVTVGCIEVSRQEASGFGVMAVDINDRIVSFLEKPADPPGLPDAPDRTLASMGIYVFETRFLLQRLREDAARAEFVARFRQGHHPVDRPRRARGRAPLRGLLRPQLGRGGGILARRRDARRLLAGQYRPDRLHPRARPLRPRLADLDLCRDRAAGQVHPRRGLAPRPGGQLAGLRRLHHLRQLHPSFPAIHRRAHALLRLDRGGGGAALRRDRPRRPSAQRRRRPRRAHPRRAGGGRGPDRGRRPLPPHRSRRVPDHQADDRRGSNEGRAVQQGVSAQRLWRRRRACRISEPRAGRAHAGRGARLRRPARTRPATPASASIPSGPRPSTAPTRASAPRSTPSPAACTWPRTRSTPTSCIATPGTPIWPASSPPSSGASRAC